MRQRQRVADFWHDIVHDFLEGDFPLRPPLDRWFRAYEGAGQGVVDRQALPEPYSGPLLGDARAVFLGLNPGVAIPAYQYRDGIVAQEIRKASHHSEVYKTTPAPGRQRGCDQHHLRQAQLLGELARPTDRGLGRGHEHCVGRSDRSVHRGHPRWREPFGVADVR